MYLKGLYMLANVLPSNFLHSFGGANPTIFSSILYGTLECSLNDSMINCWPWIMSLDLMWFLAHGKVSYYNHKRPSSVCGARFATAGSIPAKLWYVVHQGYISRSFFSFSRFDLFLSYVHLTNKDTWHDTWVFDLTYFLKVTEVNVQNGTNIGMFHYSYT
jgi:hypothetical protein